MRSIEHRAGLVAMFRALSTSTWLSTLHLCDSEAFLLSDVPLLHSIVHGILLVRCFHSPTLR